MNSYELLLILINSLNLNHSHTTVFIGNRTYFFVQNFKKSNFSFALPNEPENLNNAIKKIEKYFFPKKNLRENLRVNTCKLTHSHA